ncbi:hypothetical protein AAM22_gp08 [Pantoea phage vB_PagM_AAM22]|nr:hypothetical protein AAM22_gp08 [Pantoea phage vB_PagM_AAM22]
MKLLSIIGRIVLTPVFLPVVVWEALWTFLDDVSFSTMRKAVKARIRFMAFVNKYLPLEVRK